MSIIFFTLCNIHGSLLPFPPHMISRTCHAAKGVWFSDDDEHHPARIGRHHSPEQEAAAQILADAMNDWDGRGGA